MTIDSYFRVARDTPSDIHEHIEKMRELATDALHVTECGVRTVVSSWAWASALVGKPGARMVLVDPERHANIDTFLSVCAAEGLDASFLCMSDLECPMEETDLLFIDTWHVYGQLKRELARWHGSVRKYIVMHDTTVDAHEGESIRCSMDIDAQSASTGIATDEIRRGLQPAVDEFLAEHGEWTLAAKYENCNGLTILRRV